MRHATARSAVEREAKEKDGVFTGGFAVNPVNGEAIPIWVADYVLMEYGTGAIMAVPAHDERDHAFAERYGIEIRQVVAPADGSEPEAGAFVAHTDDEVLVNSGEFTGLPAPEGKAAITAWLAEQGLGEATIGYRLRDWLLSRQRYWGCPIPIVHCDDVRRGAGARRRSCRSSCPRWRTTCRRAARRSRPRRTGSPRRARRAAGRRGGRRTRWTPSSTRPGTSSATPTRGTSTSRSRREIADYWMPIDQYIGGIEHAVLHLLYAASSPR